MKRSFVFIDGSNFYFKLKELIFKSDTKYSLLDFDFRKFAEWLVELNKLMEIHYYIGAIKRRRNDDKSEKLYADQQRLLRNLKKSYVK